MLLYSPFFKVLIAVWYIFIISAPIVLHFVMKLKHRRTSYTDNGYPDYFDDRHKRKMLRLAGIKPSDVFYDLGCGNASILILAVKEFGVKKAVGIEDDRYRSNIARKRIGEEKLQDQIFPPMLLWKMMTMEIYSLCNIII